ncbi:MAG: diacylglycerol kinase [Deltaproteobacteria bacterium]|nr:diacylglycerol kinase [Deltaproteobacteria bacterium]
MFNSAIEALCDFIETHENHKIKVIKDISAAAAGISILLWTVILVVEFLHLRRIIAKP